MTDKVIYETYHSASDLFNKVTLCAPSKSYLIVKDATLKELNQGRNIFYYGVDGLSVGVIIGDYNADKHIIKFSIEHPDRQRVLFHEMLHFLIHDIHEVDCIMYDVVNNFDIEEEHFMIYQLEKIYFIQTNRENVPDKWIYDVLKKM